MRKLSISLRPASAMRVFDVSVASDKLVYLIRLDRKIGYPLGSSHIAYIGSTEKGISRMAQSAAAKADSCLARYGVKEFNVYVITSTGRPGARKWWRKLERAFLITFLHRYGAIPVENRQGTGITTTNEFEMFSEERVEALLKDIEEISKRPRRARRTKRKDLLPAEQPVLKRMG